MQLKNVSIYAPKADPNCEPGRGRRGQEVRFGATYRTYNVKTPTMESLSIFSVGDAKGGWLRLFESPPDVGVYRSIFIVLLLLFDNLVTSL